MPPRHAGGRCATAHGPPASLSAVRHPLDEAMSTMSVVQMILKISIWDALPVGFAGWTCMFRGREPWKGPIR